MKKLQIKVTERKLTDELLKQSTSCGNCSQCGGGSCTSCKS